VIIRKARATGTRLLWRGKSGCRVNMTGRVLARVPLGKQGSRKTRKGYAPEF
jgi:hypothetical protein